MCVRVRVRVGKGGGECEMECEEEGTTIALSSLPSFSYGLELPLVRTYGLYRTGQTN